jgi:hypothetical protein
MSFVPDRLPELRELMAALAEGRLDPQQKARLERLLIDDREARRFYVENMFLVGQLHWQHRPELQQRCQASALALRSAVASAPPREADKLPPAADDSPADHEYMVPGPQAAPRAPVLGFLNRALHAGTESLVSTALAWLMMACVCTGMVLTLFFCAVLVFRGVTVHVDGPQAAGGHPEGTRQGAGREEERENVRQGERETRDFSSSHALTFSRSSSPPPSQATVARLIQVADCHWVIGSHSPHLGDDLEPGRKLVLMSGLAEIMFQSGVKALLEGPATLEVSSRTSAALSRGKLSVTVLDPDLRGFQVRTPGMAYTDLGTEFGVFVAKDGRQEMHVFRGKVLAEEASSREQGAGSGSLPSPAGTMYPWSGRGAGGEGGLGHPSSLVLSANQAVRISAPGKPIEKIPADKRQFVRTEQMAVIVADLSPDYRRWKKFSQELSKRSDLVAYYDFQPDESDRTVLPNRAATGRKFDGRIEAGTEWCEGRWPGKQALHFQRPGNGVRVNLPEQCKQISLLAWVKTEQFAKNDYQRIIGSSTWKERAGEFHWQFSGQKNLGTGMGVWGQPTVQPYDHAHPSREEIAGRWAMFAMTYDAAGTTRLYFDGRATMTDHTAGPSVFIGEAIIGAARPNESKGQNSSRDLLGRIDELAIFRAVLSESEIRRLYERETAR